MSATGKHSSRRTRKPASFRIRLALGVGVAFLAMLIAIILVQNLALDWAFQHQADTMSAGTQTRADDLAASGEGTQGVQPRQRSESCVGASCVDGAAPSAGSVPDAPAVTTGMITTVRDGVVQWMRYGSIIIFAVFALLAVLVIWRLSARLSARLDSISRQAQQLDPEHPSARIALSNPDAETQGLADTLNDMLDRIEQANDRQRSFIRNAGHELKTPTTTIGASLEALMAQGRFPQDVRPTIQHAIDANRKSAELIASLLELSHIQSEPGARLQPVDLAALTQNVISEHVVAITASHLQIDQTGLDIGQKAADGAHGCVVQADPRYLRIALDNLLRNAIVHNIDQGTITCIMRVDDGGTSFAIANTTAPCTEGKDTDDLLQPFHRGDATRLSGRPGHGLGLSIVQSCAQAMKARLSIARPETGRFEATLRFPRQPEAMRTR
ncbi:MAG: HAMP domain-containing histidine kinase [Bifidobacterium tibiigranuli]|jgi:signal transduction histidine kinase|nr:HAMP domain-containing histidine kinase [Bifidobacterium tibiigranuli]MCI1254242.1 HAMP domain-containing histidine kinase [Bifidobacterium tibiigranuli]